MFRLLRPCKLLFTKLHKGNVYPTNGFSANKHIAEIKSLRSACICAGLTTSLTPPCCIEIAAGCTSLSEHRLAGAELGDRHDSASQPITSAITTELISSAGLIRSHCVSIRPRYQLLVPTSSHVLLRYLRYPSRLHQQQASRDSRINRHHVCSNSLGILRQNRYAFHSCVLRLLLAYYPGCRARLLWLLYSFQ